MKVYGRGLQIILPKVEIGVEILLFCQAAATGSDALARLFDQRTFGIVLYETAETNKRLIGLRLVKFGPAQLFEIGLGDFELCLLHPLAGEVNIHDALVPDYGAHVVPVAKMGLGQVILSIGDQVETRVIGHYAFKILHRLRASAALQGFHALVKIELSALQIGYPGTGASPRQAQAKQQTYFAIKSHIRRLQSISRGPKAPQRLEKKR